MSLADLVVVAHLGFVAFALAGGLLALRWRRIVWLHLPAAVWAVLVEWMGWICPLTPLENALRRAAGEVGYAGSFVEHWLAPVIYPAGLAPPTQVQLGLLVIVVNAGVYAFVLAKRRPPRGGE